jgi:phospholipase/lecithinase/hemolysin
MKKILTLFLTFLLCSNVFANPMKEFVVIGDSLSDNGNLYSALFKIVPKSPPYYNGRFSNGPTWAEDVGKYYYDKFNVNYKVIAYGGATAIWHNPAHDKFVAPITLEGEVYQYFLKSLFSDKSHVLYALWIGANDYLYDERVDTHELVNSVVDKISWTITSLAKHGAKNIVVMNLPDLARTPFARNHGNAERLHTLTIMHNELLAGTVASLQRTYPDIHFTQINIYDIFNDLLDNVEKYNKMYSVNLTDVTEACWKGGMTLQGTRSEKLNTELKNAFAKQNPTDKNVDTEAMSQFILSSPDLSLAYSLSQSGTTPCSNASEHIFWDELHPTDTVHDVLAKIFVQSVSTEM